MATIDVRKGLDGKVAYRARVRRKGHATHTATFTTRAEARKWIAITEGAIFEQRHFPAKASAQRTLGDMIERYVRDILPQKRRNTIVNQQQQLRWWFSHLGHSLLSDITPNLIAEYRDSLLQQQKSSSTVRRYLFVLSHMYTIGIREWHRIEENPVLKVSKPREPRGRVRFLSDEERERLLKACQVSKNPHLSTVVVLALATGGRKNELLSLQWKDIDLTRGSLTFHETKGGERRAVPLTGHALALLKAHARIRRIDTAYVFPSVQGQQGMSIREAWKYAVKRADIHNFRFHDLRHSYASYLAMTGASLLEIAELLGHKTLAMVKRYAHLTEAHTRSVVERMTRAVFGD
jgi:integrase